MDRATIHLYVMFVRLFAMTVQKVAINLKMIYYRHVQKCAGNAHGHVQKWLLEEENVFSFPHKKTLETSIQISNTVMLGVENEIGTSSDNIKHIDIIQAIDIHSDCNYNRLAKL